MITSFRDAMAEALLEESKSNSQIFVLTPDLARSIRLDRFMEELPQQHISTGISELNTIGVASGLASIGCVPVVAGFSMFVAVRPYEQLRNIVAYPHLNVKIFATHCGICVGKDGATHQTLEDLGLMRMLPGFTVLTACDAMQTSQAVRAALAHEGPVYLRLGRDVAEPIYTTPRAYQIGGSDVLTEGNDLAIFSMGTTIKHALTAAKTLSVEGITAAVINAYSIKPLDYECVLHYAQKCGRILTVEDHFAHCGLGSAISEHLSQVMPIPIEMVAVQDVFGESGDEDELYKKYGIDADAIVNKGRKLMQR